MYYFSWKLIINTFIFTDTCVMFQSKIKRLPAYLTIQFVRFFYKEKESVNAKILKDVKFPIEFDAFELCSPELQQKLTPMRERFKVFSVYSTVLFIIYIFLSL